MYARLDEDARPTVAASNRIKLALMREKGLRTADRSRFELDHKIPLPLGGAPQDARNLQL